MSKQPLSFDEWRAQRRYTQSVDHNDVVHLTMDYPGGLTIDHWVDDRHGIAPPDGEPCWSLTLGNAQFADQVLSKLERRLYDECYYEHDVADTVFDVPHVVIFGNPIEGIKLHGPFPGKAAANKWAEDMGEGGEWVAPVHPVTDDSCHTLYPWSNKS